MRHLADQHEVGVDPGAAITEARGGGHGAAHVLGPDRGGKAVVAVVGPAHRIVNLAEGRDRDDGAEDLAADDLVFLTGTRNDGRAVVEAALAHHRAAGGDLNVAEFAGTFDETCHPVALAERD